jgi:hypothetical protein
MRATELTRRKLLILIEKIQKNDDVAYCRITAKQVLKKNPQVLPLLTKTELDLLQPGK